MKLDNFELVLAGAFGIIICLVFFMSGVEYKEASIAKGENFVRNGIKYQCEAVK